MGLSCENHHTSKNLGVLVSVWVILALLRRCCDSASLLSCVCASSVVLYVVTIVSCYQNTNKTAWKKIAHFAMIETQRAIEVVKFRPGFIKKSAQYEFNILATMRKMKSKMKQS